MNQSIGSRLLVADSDAGKTERSRVVVKVVVRDRTDCRVQRYPSLLTSPVGGTPHSQAIGTIVSRQPHIPLSETPTTGLA